MDRIESNPTHAYARLSLFSVLLTSLATTIHHYYRFGLFTLLLGTVTMGLPALLLFAFRQTRRFTALVGYAAVCVWIIVGFGLVDGWWRSTLKLFLGNFLLVDYAQYFSWQPVGGFGFEATGIVASFTSLFAGYYTLRFIFFALPGVRGHSPRLGRSLLGVGAFSLSLLGYLAYAKLGLAGPEPADDVIKIGVIVPTQGPQALLGGSFLKAVELAKEELPRTNHRYQLVVADTGVNPVQTRAAIQKLIGVDKVRAIVGGISLPGEVIKPYATHAKIPHLCVCSVSRIGDGEYNFTNIPLPEDEAKRWVLEAQRRGIQRAALIWQDYPSIDGHLVALRRELERASIEQSFVRRFPRDTSEFAAIVAAAVASHPDVYFVEAPEPALSRLGTQLKAAGISSLSSIVAFSISSDPALFEGGWYTDSNLADPDFKARFEKRFPGTRFATHMMPYAYDSLRLLVDGFESGHDPAEYVRDKVEYSGTPGRVWRSPGSGNYRSEPAVWIIRHGQPELLR